jgi:hypothetical protein
VDIVKRVKTVIIIKYGSLTICFYDPRYVKDRMESFENLSIERKEVANLNNNPNWFRMFVQVAT